MTTIALLVVLLARRPDVGATRREPQVKYAVHAGNTTTNRR
jgi:hypothetical protein